MKTVLERVAPELEAVKTEVVTEVVSAIAGPTGTTIPELAALLQQQAGIINQQSGVIQQQQAVLNGLPQMLAAAIATNNSQFVSPAIQAAFQAVLGGALPGSLDTLSELVAHIQADESGAAAMLAQQNTDRTRFAALEPIVSGHTAALAGKALATDLSALAAAVNHPVTGLPGMVPLTGATLTGPLNVMAPTTAANPLQLSNLPLSMTFVQTLPVLALGGVTTFTVTVPNAALGQVVVLNVPPALLSSLRWRASVTAANTVTIILEAGLAIAAGAQTFYLRVLR